jgi:hypothetical protein
MYFDDRRTKRNKNQHEIGNSACYLFHCDYLLCLFFDLKMEETFFAETSVAFQRTTLHNLSAPQRQHGSYSVSLCSVA